MADPRQDQLGLLDAGEAAKATVLAPQSNMADAYLPQHEQTDFGDAVKASFLRNYLWYNLYKSASDHYSGDIDPDFRPYQYLEANKDRFSDVYNVVNDKNLFDDVKSEDNLYSKVAAIREEMKLKEAEENGSFMASLVGSGAAAIADPTSYVGVGWASKAKTGLGLVGKAMAQGGLTGAVQEAGLYGSQNLRTRDEAMMSVASNIMFSGGITAFAHALKPGSAYNPIDGKALSTDREFHPVINKDGETIRVQPDDAPEAPKAVGADVVEKEDISGQEKLYNIPGLKWFKGLTPRSRAFKRGSEVAQGIMQRLIDMTGKFTKEQTEGIAQLPNAEALRDFYFSYFCDQHFETGDRLLSGLIKDMDREGVVPVSPQDFHTATRKILGPGLEDADKRELVDRYGDQGANKIIGAASEMAQTWRKSGEEFLDLARSKGVNIPDNIKEGEYWYPQVWKRDNILRDRQAVREAMIRWLSDDPLQLPEFHDWLNEKYELTKYDFSDLEKESDVTVKRVVREEDPAHPGDPNYWIEKPQHYNVDGASLKREIMDAWAGDHRKVELERLNSELHQAQSIYKDHSVDLKNVLRQMGTADEKLTRLSLSQARKLRDQFNAKLVASQAEREQLAAEQRSLVEAATAARQTTLDRQLELTPDGLGKDVPSPTSALSAMEGRMKEIERRLGELDRTTAKAQERLQRADDLLDKVNRKKDEMLRVRDDLKQKRDLLKEAKRAAGKEVGKLSRTIEAKSNRPPLADVVDDILNNLCDAGKLPISSLDMFGVNKEIVGSRLKERRLILSKEARLEAESNGWLSTNLPEMMEQRTRQMASTTAIHEAFDLRPEGGRFGFKSWNDVVEKARSDYQSKIDSAKSNKEQQGWIKERDEFLDELGLIRDRLMYYGNYGLDNNSFLAFLTRAKRKTEMLRFGDGFGITNLADMSTLVLRNKVMDMVPFLREAFTGFKDMDGSMIQALINSHEMNKSYSYSVMHRVAEDDLLDHGGYGYGKTKEWSSKIERMLNVGVDGVSKISGLAFLNRYSKRLSGMTGMHDIANKVGRYESLSTLERTDLANLGIGRKEASSIHDMIKKYGEKTSDHFDPHLEKWAETPAGFNASRDYYMALTRHMNNSVVTLGIGDLPKSATTWWGKLYFQFMTFNFAQMDRFFQYSAQRMYITKGSDFRTLLAMNTLMFWTAVVTGAKDYLRGDDPMKRYDTDQIAKTTHELADRAGVFGPFAQAIQVAARLAGMQGASRYQRQNAWEPLLGMSTSIFSDAGRAVSTITDPAASAEERYKRTMILAPLQTTRHILERVAGGM